MLFLSGVDLLEDLLVRRESVGRLVGVDDIIVDRSAAVGIRMTLTAPACPAAQFLPGEVKRKIEQIPGVADVKVDIVWDPPWDRDRMSDAAKLQLGMF